MQSKPIMCFSVVYKRCFMFILTNLKLPLLINFSLYLGDNCIQNFHLRRYIVGYTVGNLVLRRRVSGAVKRDFRTYIRRYTSPNENFEYGYPHSNALSTFSLQKDSENVRCCTYTSSGCQLHKTVCQLHIFTCQPMKSNVT